MNREPSAYTRVVTCQRRPFGRLALVGCRSLTGNQLVVRNQFNADSLWRRPKTQRSALV